MICYPCVTHGEGNARAQVNRRRRREATNVEVGSHRSFRQQLIRPRPSRQRHGTKGLVLLLPDQKRSCAAAPPHPRHIPRNECRRAHEAWRKAFDLVQTGRDPAVTATKFGIRLWMQTPDGKQRRDHFNLVNPEGGCRRANEYVTVCDGPCWWNKKVRICTWSPGEPPTGRPTMFSPAEPSEMFNLADPPKQYDPDQGPDQFNTELEEHLDRTEPPGQ